MKEFKKVKDILSEYINFNECDVYFFGSRTKGTHRPDSDLNVLIVDKVTIRPQIVPALEEAFENSDLPYKVDLVIKSRINDEFYNRIKPDLVSI